MCVFFGLRLVLKESCWGRGHSACRGGGSGAVEEEQTRTKRRGTETKRFMEESKREGKEDCCPRKVWVAWDKAKTVWYAPKVIAQILSMILHFYTLRQSFDDNTFVITCKTLQSGEGCKAERCQARKCWWGHKTWKRKVHCYIYSNTWHMKTFLAL